MLLAAGVQAQEQTLRSRSGQFVVRGLPAGRMFASFMATGQVDYVRLDPAVLAVSCERIKETLLAELELRDAWQGTINVRVFAVWRDQEPVRLTSIRYSDGWNYGLEVPEWITRERLVKAVAQAVLTEVANRRAVERGAEMPLWLLEGVTEYLLANTPEGLTLEAATRTVKRHGAQESLAKVRETLRSGSALTLDDLSWPRAEWFDDRTYANCAHLFVHELLHLRGGRRCLAQMIAGLAENYNWQTTFLEAFSAHFGGLIDLDKWWALTVAHTKGRDAMSVWPFEQALARMDEALATSMQLRVKLNALPQTTTVKLQTIMAEWDEDRQEPLLAQKVSQLRAVRLRSPPEALELVDGYMLALQNRLRRRVNQADTIRRLDELDAERTKLNSRPAAPARR